MCCSLRFHAALRWHVWYHHGCGPVVVFSSSHSRLSPPPLNVSCPAVQLLCECGRFSVCVCVCVCGRGMTHYHRALSMRDGCETKVPLPIIQHCLMRSPGHGAGVTRCVCRIWTCGSGHMHGHTLYMSDSSVANETEWGSTVNTTCRLLGVDGCVCAQEHLHLKINMCRHTFPSACVNQTDLLILRFPLRN